MEVLILVGSRVGGYTDSLCHRLVDALPTEFHTNLINVTSLDINHCTGCESCRTTEGCVFHDDMDMILDAFFSADIVVFASPVRFNGPSSQIKTVLDRFQSVWNNPGPLSHRRVRMCLAMTSGTVEPNIRPILNIFRSFCVSIGGVWIGEAVMTDTDHGDGDEGRTVKVLSELVSGSLYTH